MTIPETLEQYLIQFLEENKNKNYPDNYNDIVDAAEFIRNQYLSENESESNELKLSELEDEYDGMRANADDIISETKESINTIIETAQEIMKRCDDWCY